MTGLYLFAAAAGIPLVLWFMLSGGEDGGGADDGLAGVMLRRLPLSTMSIVAATFGVCGLLLTAAGTGAGSTFLAAVIVSLLAGVLNGALFSYLRRSGSTTEVSDEQLAGKIGRVVVPVAGDRRGRIAVSVGDQQIHLSAHALPGTATELGAGSEVLVVEVHKGIAQVTALDPELS
jgi:membrane protein implicated in regulation of membrane protease activity